MLAGFSGHLFAEAFLEQHTARAGPVGVRRALDRWRRTHAPLGPAASVRAVLELTGEPLARALGYRIVERPDVAADCAVATLRADQSIALLLVTAWGERLDRHWRRAVVEAQGRGAGWCLLFNGTHLRLIQAGRTYSRRYVEFDVDLALADAGACGAMVALVEPGAIPRLDALVRASDQHAADVCRSLRAGVLEASAAVLGALLPRRADARLDTAFEQALTIVYRVLFLLFAEARRLVPVWHPVYHESYSVDALRAAAESDVRAPGCWDALRAMGRLAHGGCRAGDLHVTAFNGRLFAPARTPLVDRRHLDDGAARRAVLALATRPVPGGAGRERISYRDLGVEQLGAVYEALLDYEPRVSKAPITPPPPRRSVEDRDVRLVPGSGVRKATGTFYTPRSIVDYLVRRTLGPLVRGASPEQILALRVLDPAMGSGAFLVAACRYLARAHELALIESGGCHSSDLGAPEQASIRRTIAERCLYGVDVNPMAVQLARLSLWLTTLAFDRPLSFLDHRLQAGDSLLGVWLSCLRRQPAGSGPRRAAGTLPLFDDAAVSDMLRGALPVRFSLATASDTAGQVRDKERAFAALQRRETQLSRWKRIADLWCARWFSGRPPPPSAFAALSDVILTGRGALSDRAAAAVLEGAETAARDWRLFHWELEFPEAFFDASGSRRPDGGFDAVLGNPPWDMIRADTGPDTERQQARHRTGAVLRFARDAGVYRRPAEGHANRYQLFVERAVDLARPGGRLGLVLPFGLAADQGSAPIRRMLFSRCSVEALVGFDNRHGVFPIHRSVRFLLLTAANGGPTGEVACRFGERDPLALEQDDGKEPAAAGGHAVRVTPALLARLTGDGLAIPDLRSPIDLALAERAAALFRPVGDESGWAARFGRELNATEDRSCFGPANLGMPVIEGRLLAPFRVDLGAARWGIAQRDAARLLRGRPQRARLAYRDVASPTNRQTLIAAILPSGCVSTHTVFCLRTALRLEDQHLLCGLFNSLVVNYLVRLRVTTHVTTAIVERLPIPDRQAGPSVCREIAALARLLGRQPRNAAALARLNARVAHLYRLSRAELVHVLETFPLVPGPGREAVLAEFARLGS